MKRWLFIFAGTVLACSALMAAYNVLLDPFGVFGDRLLDWYAYDMTMNPRVAKIAYLDAHHRDYDSYVVGSSKASSLPVDALNRYLDASFYNMTWYGGDLQDEARVVRYLADHYSVKHLVLTVDLQDASDIGYETDPIKGNMHCKPDGSNPVAFYGRYLFANPAYGLEKLRAYCNRGYLMRSDAVYVPETGCYNKQLRDLSPIRDLESYLAAENNVIPQPDMPLPYVAQALKLVGEIVDYCGEKGIDLHVVGIPIQNGEFYAYDHEQARAYWTGLAEITDFWVFWGNGAVNGDMRYFYDTNHFRNCVGEMVLARMFGNEDVWVPEGFGALCTEANAAALIERAYADTQSVPETEYTARLPILIYHDFCETEAEESNLAVCRERFESHLAALAEAGYTPVLYRDALDYVRRGMPLPDRPVMISFDDGYRSNLDIAAPLLAEYGAKAEISVIGVSVGKDTYRDTGTPIIPHFSLEEAGPWTERGTLAVESHSYDLHRETALDGEDCRTGVLRMEGEDEFGYVALVEADFRKAKAQIEAALGTVCEVFTYPGGYYELLSEAALHSCGAAVTVTTEERNNTLVKGIPQSLYLLGRRNVTGGTTAEEVLALLAEQ
ncbi:MAG: polysaccharide deacetylase family protein [Oscillospiraceae bacterium]|nr:polysaccharide deacetylase family protein [Oscillospiraceae bacterium]